MQDNSGIYSSNRYLRKIQKKWFRRCLESKYFSEFYRTLPSPAPNGKKLLFYVGIPYMYLSPLEILIYQTLRSRGWDVDYYVYDSSVKLHELTTSAYQGDARLEFIEENIKDGINLLESSQVDYKTIPPLSENLSKFIADLNTLEALIGFEYRGYQLGKIVERVLFRYYKSVELIGKDDVLEVGKLFLDTVLRNLVCSESLLRGESYHAVMFSHGIYCTWEPVVEVCTKLGVDFFCYDRGKTQNTMNINKNQVSPDWSFDSAWIQYSERELKAFEASLVDRYLRERELQKGDVYSYNFKERESNLDDLKGVLGVAAGKKVVTFFTNLIWDAANVDRDEVFPSFVAAIEHTSRLFSNRNDVQILVRTHPAEQVLGTNQQYKSLISNQYDNVSVIDEELAVNSFSVLDVTDIAVTHTSTVGLEMAMTGKPSILLGKTHYKHKGFTFDPIDLEDYESVISELLNDGYQDSASQKRKALARKYFYMMMFLYQQRMPAAYTAGEFSRYSADSFKEAALDSTLVDLLNRIEDKDVTHFVNWQ